MQRPTAAIGAFPDARPNFRARLKDVTLFFQRRDEVHKSMNRLVKRLDKAGLPYAVVGGMAVLAHKYRRTTGDVDILLNRAGLQDFKRLFVPKKYAPVDGRPRRFIDRANDVHIDILVTGLFPGSGQPGPIAYPDPQDVRVLIDKIPVIDLENLIRLKLAARRHQDFADVVHLIGANGLDESFLAKLHPPQHRDFIECLEEKRREDEYMARQSEDLGP